MASMIYFIFLLKFCGFFVYESENNIFRLIYTETLDHDSYSVEKNEQMIL